MLNQWVTYKDMNQSLIPMTWCGSKVDELVSDSSDWTLSFCFCLWKGQRSLCVMCCMYVCVCVSPLQTQTATASPRPRLQLSLPATATRQTKAQTQSSCLAPPPPIASPSWTPPTGRGDFLQPPLELTDCIWILSKCFCFFLHFPSKFNWPHFKIFVLRSAV